MIDIHSHILPGIDDGAQMETDSIAMAKAAVDEGITKIIATPHHKNRTYENYKTDILKHVSVLNDLFAENNLPLTVLSGQEIRIFGEIIEDYEAGELLTVNETKYMLIEFPSDSVPQYAEQLFYDMQLAGLIPVIVHPERNRELITSPNRMYDLIRNGALSQVTAASVIGKFGKQIATFSHELIEANLTHFVASDAHNTTSRGFHLHEAYQAVREAHGLDSYYMLLENSHLLVDNMNVNRMEPMPVRKKRKKLFGLF